MWNTDPMGKWSRPIPEETALLASAFLVPVSGDQHWDTSHSDLVSGWCVPSENGTHQEFGSLSLGQ